MRFLPVLFFIIAAITAFCRPGLPGDSAHAAAPDTLRTMWLGNLDDIWLSTGNGNAILRLDPWLYTREESEHYYLHFTFYNSSGKTLGVDLRDAEETVFLNQAAAFNSDALLEVHNEILNAYRPLPAEQRKNLLDAYQQKTLHFVEAGKRLEYYREFTGGKKEETRQLFDSVHHLSLYLNGRLAFTDGEKTYEFLARHSGDTVSAADHTLYYFDRKVRIEGPVVWKTIPPGVQVIPDRPADAYTPTRARSRR